CGTTTTFGDPRRAWVNTVLAASHSSGPIPLYPPLSHALSLFPHVVATMVMIQTGSCLLMSFSIITESYMGRRGGIKLL
ncbi:hypothetical protein ACSLPA_34180, partial [Escherichia coli]